MENTKAAATEIHCLQKLMGENARKKKLKNNTILEIYRLASKIWWNFRLGG